MNQRLVLISDTHLRHNFEIPAGDILVHAGDLTMGGTIKEVASLSYWLERVKKERGFQEIVIVPGNHDWLAEKDPTLMRTLIEEAGCIYLDHKPKEVLGLKFFGSGYTPRFYDWALNVDRGPELAALWAQIPDDTQVLVTHGPPKGRRDACKRGDDDDWQGRDFRYKTEHVGCADLARRIQDLKALKLHVFGHIHHQYGMETGADGITYANASICDPSYTANNKPLVVDLPV